MYHLTDDLIAAVIAKYGEGLQRLNLSNNNLRTIQNIQRFSDLRHLNLSGNYISDIAPLAEVTTLESLNLAENRM